MSTFLSAAQLARMREQVEMMLPGTAVIQARSLSSDGAGGQTESWTARGTVACRVDPVPRAMQLDDAGQAEALRVEYQITLGWDVTIEPTDRIVTGGETYEIRQFQAEHSWNVSKRVKVSRIE